MENASKALIIAGAILLSILIIGLGITVYNNASSTTGQANLDGQEVSAHNSKFTAYEGRQKGSNVTTLLTAIQSNNSEYDDRQISVALSTTTSKPNAIAGNSAQATYVGSESGDNTLAKVRAAIKSSTTYKVEFDTAANGLIQVCYIYVYSNT